MKRFWLASLFACLCLSVAAVWLGGLNQDEGWYLYAANMVHEGKRVYADFFFTQGPVMPIVYSAFAWAWKLGGVLAARCFTLILGLAGVVIAAALAYRLAPEKLRREAALVTFMLLGCNLYHLYYVAIPKTYALAGLLVIVGFYLMSFRRFMVAGLALAFAAGTRISLGAILPVIGVALLLGRRWRDLLWFCIGAAIGLALLYGPIVIDSKSLAGLIAAQQYHAARGGFDPVFTVGSFSRLIRWYLPLFIVLGIGSFKQARLLAFAFLAVFVVQMLAPFPYEDYQVPIMALLAVFAAVNYSHRLLLVLGLAFACAFGSPLLEKWMTNGQDRFWPLKKDKCELAQLRDTAKAIEALDPDGKSLLTQDLYLAIETGRQVPAGLEMGPFSMLDDAQWRQLLKNCDCPVAALSGYTFAVEPPKCNERDIETQMQYWQILRERYEMVDKVDAFGQNATPLLILKRK